MRSRRKKQEPATEPVTEPFFSKEKKESASTGASPFFQKAPVVQRKLADGGSSVIQMAPEDGGKDAGAPGSKDGGSAKVTGAPDAGPATFSVSTIKKEYVATVFSEAWPGQESDIAWIYYNLLTKDMSISALKKSSAFRLKSDNFKIAMTALGDLTFAEDAPTDKWLKDVKATSIKDYVDNNSYFKNVAEPRIKSIDSIINGIITTPATNPYPGWTGQGNLDDFNNISSPGSKYWKMARAYFWLQEADSTVEKLVKALGNGPTMQFIFNGKKIENYYKLNQLSQEVPKYSPTKKP